MNNTLSQLEEAFQAKDITSAAMKAAIETWFALYFEGNARKGEDDCQRLPVLVVNKLCKTVFSECEITASDAKKTRMQPLLDRLKTVQKKALQQGMIGGECLIKPVLLADSFDFVLLRRDCFVPLARDARGNITSVASAEVTAHGNRYYTLAERRTVLPNGDLRIESALFVSDMANILGTRIPLASLAQYAGLQPELVLPGMGSIGMATFKSPQENSVDGSNDGVSVYAPAVGLIRNINRNEQQLNDEFENGASRIIASADMLATDAFGKKRFDDKQFVAVDDDIETVGVTIFSPVLREASYLARKQDYLRAIENQIGFKRGILSAVEAAERTATEITSSAGDYNLTITDMQGAWEKTVKELLYICDQLGQRYFSWGQTFYDLKRDLIIDWGDGVLYNRDKTWQEYQGMVASGMLKPELAVAWYFELPHKSERDFEYIRKHYMPQIAEMAAQ